MNGPIPLWVRSGFLLLAVGCTACGSTPSECTPGMSIPCTGAGGCAGGQACNADGTGYEACECGAPDSGPQDAGSTDSGPVDGAVDAASPDAASPDAGLDDAGLPVEGALHVAWTFSGSATCADFAAEDGVSVQLVPEGSTTPIEGLFDCEAGSGDVGDLAFGSYMVDVTLIDATGTALGTAPRSTVVLAASPCDRIVAGDCAQDLAVTIAP